MLIYHIRTETLRKCTVISRLCGDIRRSGTWEQFSKRRVRQLKICFEKRNKSDIKPGMLTRRWSLRTSTMLSTVLVRVLALSVLGSLLVQGQVCIRVDIQDTEHVCTTVPQRQRIKPPRQRTDTTLDGYATAHPTVRSHRLRETFFSMRRAVCLELTSCVCHRQRLTV